MAPNVHSGVVAGRPVSAGLGRAGGPRYLPIAEHGLIGDLHTSALVGTDGTIDWYCCPRFDSPSVFGAVLDSERGGLFRIAPAEDGWSSKQLYLPDTNVLVTRFLMADGVGEIQDFMPPDRGIGGHRQRIVRRVLAVRGEIRFVVDVAPRFDYARAGHAVALTPHGAAFRSSDLALNLSAGGPLKIVEGTDVRARVALRAGQTSTFVLEGAAGDKKPVAYSDADIAAEFDATVAFWRRWLQRSQYSGRWRETVHRSALTLKLLTYTPTGAIVAAPTTSLPEQLGGARNWDYRFTWMRDSAFTLYALLRLGFTEEAGGFMSWLEGRFHDAADGESGPLQIMYGIDGREDLPEEELSHLEGYMGSAPVRIGNGAATQLQLDIYGELMDSVYLCNKYGLPIYHEGWMEVTRNLEWLMGHWDQPDEGIWETRSGRRDYTYSRLMSWVAVERAIRVARQRGLPADIPRWTAVRDRIYNQIMERGWHPARRAFVQHYDTDVVDASLLLMPLCKFIAPTDPRWISTLDAITHELVSDSLVYRYNVDASPDGLAGQEATFSLCSFWWVEALARAGRLEEARLAFEKMLTYGNHVGLYSEEIGPTGEQLGNFPQAFTHVALISAAYNLDRQLG
jgi:GH15 family glucan-1,4-alpha-glucosidase